MTSCHRHKPVACLRVNIAQFGWALKCQGDQRGDDALSLCYDSEPVAEDCDIVGAAKVKLRLTSDTPDGQIAVRLNHIHPDGASTRITYGVLNLAQRDDHANANALPIGQEIEVSLDLDHIAYRVPKGTKYGSQFRTLIGRCYGRCLTLPRYRLVRGKCSCQYPHTAQMTNAISHRQTQKNHGTSNRSEHPTINVKLRLI